MKTLLPLRPLLVGALLFSASTARAEVIGYSYTWDMASSGVLTGTNPDTGNGLSTGSVAFALSAPGTNSSVLGSSTATPILGSTISTTSSAGGGASPPDAYNTPVSLLFQLTDTSSGKSGTFTFNAALQGTLTATASNLTVTFGSPLTQTQTLGGHVYSVTIDPTLVFVPAPGASGLGSIEVLVKVGGATQAPEPSTLLLAALALPWLGRTCRRQQKTNATEA